MIDVGALLRVGFYAAGHSDNPPQFLGDVVTLFEAFNDVKSGNAAAVTALAKSSKVKALVDATAHVSASLSKTMADPAQAPAVAALLASL